MEEITKEEMQRLLRDASDTSRAQSELRLAWGLSFLNVTECHHHVLCSQRRRAFIDRFPKCVSSKRCCLPWRKSSRQLLAAYRKARALNPPTKFNVDPSEKKLVPRSHNRKRRQLAPQKKESRSRLDAGRPIAGQISDLLKTQMKEMITLMREWDEDEPATAYRMLNSRKR